MVLGGTGSVWGGAGLFLVILGQYGAVLVGTWWHWVNIGWYWLIFDGNGSVQGGTGRYLVVLGQLKAVLGQNKAVRAKVFGCHVEKV